MELWIRSQSRKNLMKVEDIVANDNYIEVYKMNDESTRIAEYETPERALEVLDEIQNILKPKIFVRENEDNEKILLCGLQHGVTQKMDMEFKELSTYVYQMPKE